MSTGPSDAAQPRTGKECASPEREILLPYALGSADPSQQDRFEEHVLGCTRCAEDLHALERTRSLIRRYILEGPPELAVLRAARRRRRLLVTLVRALLLAVALLGGFWLGAS